MEEQKPIPPRLIKYETIEKQIAPIEAKEPIWYVVYAVGAICGLAFLILMISTITAWTSTDKYEPSVQIEKKVPPKKKTDPLDDQIWEVCKEELNLIEGQSTKVMVDDLRPIAARFGVTYQHVFEVLKERM